MSFSGLAVAAKAMKHLGAPTCGDLGLRPDSSYFLFADHSFRLGIDN
jgi:hypothetical protein